ncbi:phospholipase D-like domain-containing protein [Neisseriaceae bacterium TC5R-5]|nr:phospholipase D-like domain-containing protein [Neisseriaceae bacterium TC5R-5]
MSDLTRTARADTVHVDRQKGSAIGGMQYFVEKVDPAIGVPKYPPVHADNQLQLYLCGEQAFTQIAADIQAAQKSIELVCWGFDPGMMLIRPDEKWQQQYAFGELLEQATKRGVKVRLLAWHSYSGGAVQDNLPGYSGWLKQTTTTENGAIAGGIIGGVVSRLNRNDADLHRDYNVAWFRRHMTGEHGISLAFRDGNTAAIKANLKLKEVYAPSGEFGAWPIDGKRQVSEKFLLESNGTHHQKTLVFDYQPGDGKTAPRGIAYVMGLNSVTDYWDTADHLIDDPRRETGGNNGFDRKKPYQDYASRIQGGTVQDVYDNFLQGWQRAKGKDPTLVKGARPASPVASSKKDSPQPVVNTGPVALQLLRTQPEDREKSIKALYKHTCLVAANWMYIENQYFYYQEWAEHLLAARKSQNSNWQKRRKNSTNPQIKQHVDASDKPLLHLFVVIPEPESQYMVPRTYDTLKVLGQEGGMRGKETDEYGNTIGKVEKGQDVLMRQKEESKAYQQYLKDKASYDAQWDAYKKVGATSGQFMGMQISIPPPSMPLPKNPVTPGSAADQAIAISKRSAGELEKEYGLKVCTAMLYSSGMVKDKMRYRDIYIHSKLLMLDDSLLSLGSANLNQRSMSADSEINIACNHPQAVTGLRRAVFAKFTQGKVNLDPVDKSEVFNPQQMAARAAFNDWIDLMEKNAERRNKKNQMVGFLLPFKELRECEHRNA